MIGRISDRQTFVDLRTNARQLRGNHVHARYLDDGAVPPRVGFAIGKKHGNAVARNRARRRIRAVCGELMPPAAVNGTFLFSLRTSFREASYLALRDDVAAIIEQAK